MATIVKRQRKDGVAYLFQVKVKNPLTGEFVPKSKTWNPPKDLSAKQAMREATVLADAFEKEVRDLHNTFNLQAGLLTPDSRFEEVAQAWIDKTKANQSPTHWTTSEPVMNNHILPVLGKIKLNKITPILIQNFFDKLDARVKTTTTIRTRVDVFKRLQIERNMPWKYIVKELGFDDSTYDQVLKGKRSINPETATKYANAFDVPLETLFTVTTTQKPYAYNTNRNIKSIVRAILGFAKKKRLIQDNWATNDYIDFPRREQKEVKILNENQVQIIREKLRTFSDIRKSTLMLTLLFTGMRKGEVIGLRWCDIDFSSHFINVERSVYYIGKGLGTIVKEPKTEKSKRMISIPQFLVNQLASYKEWYDKLSVSLGDAWRGEDWLFINKNTTNRVSPDHINAWVTEVLEYCGIEHHTVHSLRHTNITMKLMNGINVMEVSADAGHSRKTTTMDTYAHLLKTHQSKSAELFESKFGDDNR